MGDISATALIELAVDLTNSVTSQDRFDRLLSTVRQAITCDAVVLLKQDGAVLTPLAQQGLTSDSLGRRFDIASHPRLADICRATSPIRFPADSPLPDPYDGMLLAYDGKFPVHACMGLPLLVDGRLVGVLTVDSMTPNIFDDIPKRTLDMVSAMSAAALNTAMLLQQLEKLSQHNQQVVEELTHEALTKDGGELMGDSAPMCQLKNEINLVAPSDFSVLIEGETGVGKELVARTIHRQSSRHHGPLVYVNCAAIPENLVESELFGHVKGAFTGAESARVGKFNLANNGTIFLDEIGELPLAAQSKLLRVIQNQEIQPVGQDKVETIDVRILAATNRQLKEEVAAHRFRADLYHRLSVYPIHIPPLRERQGDSTILAGYFAEQVRRKLGLQQLVLEPAALDDLQRYAWPGNVRELEHVISRAALQAKASSASAIVKIQSQHLGYLSNTPLVSDVMASPPERQSHPVEFHHVLQTDNIASRHMSLKQSTDAFQRQYIVQVLQEEQANWTLAAKRLGVDRANLSRLAKRLGVVVNKKVVLN
jgi:anaerobic nitric oxide reductase transcription regulator